MKNVITDSNLVTIKIKLFNRLRSVNFVTNLETYQSNIIPQINANEGLNIYLHLKLNDRELYIRKSNIESITCMKIKEKKK